MCHPTIGPGTPRNGRCVLNATRRRCLPSVQAALLWASGFALAIVFVGCAQVLGTGGYEEDPDAFDEGGVSVAETETSGGGATESGETEETDAGTEGAETEETAAETETGTGTDTPTDPTMPVLPPDAGMEPTSTGQSMGGAGGTSGMAPDSGTDPAEGGAAGDAAANGGTGGMVGAGGAGGAPPNCDRPTPGPCAILSQCGCNAGEMCIVANTTTGATACVSEGNTDPYSHCDDSTDCQAGHGCVAGVCKAFCDMDETPTCDQGPYASCDPVTVNGEDVSDYAVCLRTCDPLDSTRSDATYEACGPGVNCLPGPSGVSSCVASTSNGTQGSSCEDSGGNANPTRCAPGFACVTVDSDSTCKRQCEPGVTDCGIGFSCLSYEPNLGAASRSIGYCERCPGASTGSCDPVSQCGCAAGQMCSITDFETGALGCVDEGTTLAGDSCNVTVGECEPGTDCLMWYYTGVCSPFCETDADCNNGEPCVEWEVPGVKHCLSGCDLRNPLSNSGSFNGCESGQSCAIWADVPDSSVCITPMVAAPEGGTCSSEDTCGPGLTCVGTETDGVCEPWCDMNGNDCRSGEECVAHPYLDQFLSPITLKGLDYGVCLPPQFEQENTTSVAIPDGSPDDDYGSAGTSLQVSGAPYPVGKIVVEVNISHAWIGDVIVVLEAPDDDTFILLFDSADLTLEQQEGSNMIGTVFDDDATTLVTDGTNPYTGTFRPSESLSIFNGFDPNGEWDLWVFDSDAVITGTLNSWKLTIY